MRNIKALSSQVLDPADHWPLPREFNYLLIPITLPTRRPTLIVESSTEQEHKPTHGARRLLGEGFPRRVCVVSFETVGIG